MGAPGAMLAAIGLLSVAFPSALTWYDERFPLAVFEVKVSPLSVIDSQQVAICPLGTDALITFNVSSLVSRALSSTYFFAMRRQMAIKWTNAFRSFQNQSAGDRDV